MKDRCKWTLLTLFLGLSVGSLWAQDSGNQPGPGGGPPRRGPGGRGGFGGGRAAFQAAPLAKDEAEQKILDVLEEMGRNRGIGVPRDDGRLLRLLVESSGAKHVVELGTYRGYSGTWMCLGLRTTGGKLTTFEIDPRNAETSRANFKRAGVDSLVTLIEGDAHQEVSKIKDPIDLVFIDADKEGYTDYFTKLLPLVRPGGLIVAHNIDSAGANPEYVKAITTNKSADSIWVTTGSGGIGVSMKKR